MTIKEWIRREVLFAAGDLEFPVCPDGYPEEQTPLAPYSECLGCPYHDVFSGGGQRGCSRFVYWSEEHKTAACLLAAIHEVEI